MSEDNEELVPISQVLDDMYADKGIVSLAARDYYYLHYADDEQREQMDREEKIQTIIAYIFVVSTLAAAIAAMIIDFLM